MCDERKQHRKADVGADRHNVDAFLCYWKKQIAFHATQSERLAQKAHQDAQRVALMLSQKYRVARVLLFGSLARGRFDRESDIDLAVVGLSPEQLFPALADANALSHFWIDLKPFEELEPHFRARILQTGENLL